MLYMHTIYLDKMLKMNFFELYFIIRARAIDLQIQIDGS